MSSLVRRTVVPVVLTVTGAFALGACSGSSEEKEAAACESYTAFAEAVSGLDTLDQSSTVDEIAAVRDDVAAAYEDLEEDLDDVARDRADKLSEAWEQFRKAVDYIDGEATVSRPSRACRRRSARSVRRVPRSPRS